MRKPILYNGFVVGSNVRVIRRIAHECFTDIYKLTNGRYLYLFTRLSQRNAKKEMDGLFTVCVGEESYLAIIAEQYSIGTLRKTISSITTLRGFNAVAGMRELKRTLTHEAGSNPAETGETTAAELPA